MKTDYKYIQYSMTAIAPETDRERSGRLWIISELYYPEQTSTGYFLTRIAEGLARHFPVCVLCSQPTYSARGNRAPMHETRNQVSVHRCFSTTLNKDVLIFRLINLLTISVSIFIEALFRIRRRDRVLVVTNPPLLPFLVALACWIRRARCLLLVHDVYPEVLVAAGMAESGSVASVLVSWLTRHLYKSMERIIVLGRDMQELVRHKLGGMGPATVIIPNWGDVDQISPQPREGNALLRQLKLTDKFVVQYSGNMGRTHGLEDLAESAKTLRNTPEVHYLFIGSGAKKGWLVEQTERLALGNITILPNHPREDLSNSLNACDAAVISFAPGMKGVSVPSRMYNILAAGKPIIAVADADSELALVVKEEQVGWVVPPGEPGRIAQTILDARKDPQRLQEMGARARKCAESKYSFQTVSDAYRALFQDSCDE